MRLTLAKGSQELARRGIRALLAKGGGYFYFRSGETADWLDRMVPVARIDDLSIEGWVAKFRELKRVNQQLGTAKLKRKSAH